MYVCGTVLPLWSNGTGRGGERERASEREREGSRERWSVGMATRD